MTVGWAGAARDTLHTPLHHLILTSERGDGDQANDVKKRGAGPIRTIPIRILREDKRGNTKREDDVEKGQRGDVVVVVAAAAAAVAGMHQIVREMILSGIFRVDQGHLSERNIGL